MSDQKKTPRASEHSFLSTSIADHSHLRASWIPRLPAAAWWILVGDLCYWFSIGLFVPYFVIYLHQVRSIPLSIGGLTIATGFATGFLFALLAGFLSDNVSSRWTQMSALVCAIVGAFMVPFIHDIGHAFVAAILLLGCGQSVVMPMTATLLAARVAPFQRTGAFTVRYTDVNVGFGIGTMVASFILTSSRPSSFLVTSLIQAFLCGVYLVILVVLPRQPHTVVAASLTSPNQSEEHARSGIRALVRDTSFWLLWCIAFLFYGVGIAQLPNGFTLYATRPGHSDTHALGLALAINSFVIVILQFVVVRWMKGHLRTRALCLLFVVWLLAWGSTTVAGQLGAAPSANVLFAVAASFFGLGETLMAPILFPLVMSLAPDDSQGRYTATISLASSAGFVLAPVLSGALLGSGNENIFLLVMFLGCGSGILLSWLLGRKLSRQINEIEVLA